MFKNIQSALVASFFGLVFITLVVFALIATPSIRSTTVHYISEEIAKELALSQADFVQLLETGASSRQLRALTEHVAQLAQCRVTLISDNGRVLADSATTPNELQKLENHGQRPEIVMSRTERFGLALRKSETLDQNLIYVAKSIRSRAGQPLGYLRFAVPSTHAVDLVIKIHKAMAIALAFALLTAICLSIIFARAYSVPIARLANISHRIAMGDFSQRIKDRSRFEIGQLEAAVDTMSQRLAETFEKLTLERGQMSAILSGMAEGVLAVDQDGRLILINPVVEDIFGIVEPEAIGKTAQSALHNAAIASLVQQALSFLRTVKKELQLSRHNAEETFLAQASPIRNDQGKLLGSVCVLYNISELRRLEKHRSEFVANVSHELKTPLTAIRNYVETLAGGAVNEKELARDFLNKIEKHAINLSRLIDDILEISQLEAKKDLGPFIRLDLADIIKRAIETISEKAKKKSIVISVECSDGDAYVLGIEEHIYRAALNLLDNAVSYTESGGQIEVFCLRQGSKVKLAVADTGIGIPADEQERIFERFYRVDKARSRELGGTGLGLSIVKHVMNTHNGSIEVNSVIGQGSTFTLVFPSAD
ncbi:MAG: PAS domain-containing protein [Candidatus Saganbacteria bacterium]|nr:PAS domain-containing protein [Candidatus Saganbacteria bacterium]